MPIIRNLLLLAGAVLLIPTPPEEAVTESHPIVEASGFLDAAGQTVADLSGFCLRQPDVCETAHYVAGKLERKAKYGVKLLYEWANEAGSDDPTPHLDQADADAVVTGSLKLAKVVSKRKGTLIATDLAPAWRPPDSKG